MSSHVNTPLQYKLITMGNPLEPQTEARANALGKLGWDLVAIDAGVWIFKRALVDEDSGALEAIMAETIPLAEEETSIVAERA